MFNSGYTGKLISSVFITGLLTYVMFNTTSPKIVFVPFLICAVSMALKTVGQIFEKEGMKVALVQSAWSDYPALRIAWNKNTSKLSSFFAKTPTFQTQGLQFFIIITHLLIFEKYFCVAI